MTALFALAVLYGDDAARKRFSHRYVMIDEFQDTNELQLKIALLILKEPNLCVVGDWKQGIYGFRHASIDNITRFDEKVRKMTEFLNRGEVRITFRIPEAKKKHLKMNYRSSQTIIDTAFSTLTIKGRKGEVIDPLLIDSITKITAARKDIGDNTKVELLIADSREDEISAVLCQVRRYVTDPGYRICGKDGDRMPGYGDITILCPSNVLCREICDRAGSVGIPAYLQGDLEIMSTREGKLALAWLRYINNENDPMGIAAILNDMGYSMSEMEIILDEDDRKIPEELSALRGRLRGRRRRLNNLLTSVFAFHGLNNDITQSIISVLSSAHRESLLTIPDVIRLIEDDIQNGTAYNVDALLDRKAVTIQTIHKSKGLEYPIVIIAGVDRSVFPKAPRGGLHFRYKGLYGIRAIQNYSERGDEHAMIPSWEWILISKAIETDYDEARRMFFVAVSRAKQYLTMTAYKPSAFMTAFGENNFIRADTDLRTIAGSRREPSERPMIPEYERRRTNMSVHELMGMETPVGKSDEAGKGTDHGNRVHEAAELLAAGKRPKEHLDEIPEIERILESLKDADILTETACTLPVGDVTVRGVIDLIAVYPDRAEVHDYKTDLDESNLGKYRIQVSVYAAAVSSYLGKRTEGFVDFVSLGTVKKVDLMTVDDIAAVIDSVRARFYNQ
jgi:ATP-dependent exoDNAse (exonuclease V) beta subunit